MRSRLIDAQVLENRTRSSRRGRLCTRPHDGSFERCPRTRRRCACCWTRRVVPPATPAGATRQPRCSSECKAYGDSAPNFFCVPRTKEAFAFHLLDTLESSKMSLGRGSNTRLCDVFFLTCRQAFCRHTSCHSNAVVTQHMVINNRFLRCLKPWRCCSTCPRHSTKLHCRQTSPSV